MEGPKKKKGSLNVSGRLLEIACRWKAKQLGIEKYPWSQLANESGTSEASISRATQSKEPQQPKFETVFKWWQVLGNDDLTFEDGFFNAFGYSSPRQRRQAETYVLQLEQEGQ